MRLNSDLLVLRKLVKKILLGLNFLAIASILLSYLSVYLNPEKIAFPAFFGLAYPYILLINIVFIIIWGVNLKKEVSLSIIAILLGITHFGNSFKFSKKEIEDYDFNLTTYNIRLFNHYETEENNKESILNLFIKNSPDILCLQEYFLQGSKTDINTDLASLINPDYNIHSKFIRIRDNKYYGIATFTKFPIINRGDIVHPETASLSIYTDILINSDTIRIYNNHLQSFKLRRMEKSLIEEISASDQNGTMKELKNLSLSLKQGFARRANQARMVKTHMNTSPYPLLVCGDFNDTPVSFSYRRIRKGLKDAFVETGGGAGFTYKGKYPPNRIDYILFDERIVCDGFSIDRIKHSDHYPVSSFFSFPH